MYSSKLSDEKLVHLVRSQDQELYRHLIQRYQQKLMRYATYLTQDPDQAADVVQESFIKVFTNLHGFNTKMKFSSWIYRIVHNQALNQIKKEKKMINFDPSEWFVRFPSSQNIEEEYLEKETKKEIKQCLGELPFKYRSVLTLFYLEDKKYKEISEILKLPLGTIAVRLSRAKKLMRQIYSYD